MSSDMTKQLIKLLAEERPDLIAVFFDSGAPTVRLAKDAGLELITSRDGIGYCHSLLRFGKAA